MVSCRMHNVQTYCLYDRLSRGRRKILLLFTLCMILHFVVSGQQHVLKFKNISTEQGLSENTVLDIIQDPFGFMWFATENGLTKFDGMNYTVFRHDDLDTTSLLNDEIQSLCVQGDELLIASVYPIVISAFNLKTEKFRVVLSFDQTDDVEKAYFLSNDNYTLLFTHREKYIYNDKLRKFEVYQELNDLFDAMSSASGFESDNSAYLPKETEHYYLDKSDHLVGFKPDCGIMEIYLPELSYKTLFTSKEFMQLYKFDKKEELLEAFIYRDSEKRIWFNVNRGELGFFHHISGTYHSRFQDVFIKDVFEDADNNLWFASESGILFYESEEDQIQQYTHMSEENYSLSNIYTSSIFMNNHEILWVGHDGGGVDYARYYNIKNFQHLDDQTEISLISDNITGISESLNNTIWVSTDRGVSKWDMQRKEITNYLKDEFISSIYCDSKGQVWCVTNDDKILLKEADSRDFGILDFKNSDDVFGDLSGTPLVFFEDKQNRLWLIGQGLFLIDFKTRQFVKNEACTSINYATSVREDDRGYFWITGNEGRLIVVQPDLKTCAYYSSEIKNPYSLNSNILWDAHIDEDQNIWIATNEGVNKTNITDYVSGDQLRFESYTINDGLNDEIVFRILEDNEENLWFATNNGLSKLNKYLDSVNIENTQNSKFTNYFLLDGIAANSIGRYTNNHKTYLCAAKLINGEFLLGSSYGITRFNPESIAGNLHKPPVLFTDLKIFNRSVPIGSYNGRNILSQSISTTEDIELTYKDKLFSLDFIALDYTDPKKNQYEYMLDGFDDEWIFLGNSRVVTFTNIPGGDYTLRIRAANNEGYWNEEEASIGIRIKPPFWKYFWFKVFVSLFIIGSMIAFYYIRIQRIKQQKIRLESQVKERTKVIELKNEELEENKTLLEDQSEELRVINSRLIKQKSELQKLNIEVEKANQAKLRFFTNISHELRTPLTLIMGPIDNILANEKLSSIVSDQLGMMRRNTIRLLKLINQLLDFRKLETEHMKLAVSEGDIAQYLKDIFLLFTNVSNQKNIDFQFESSIDKLYIWFDADKIEKIISNLLSNAFKHTPEGGKISVSLNLEEESDESDKKVEIRVSDNGKGISKNKVEQIFERYYSAADLNSKDAASVGIGLALTKMLIELHKGSIAVKSKVASEDDNESGSEFIIKLPLDKNIYSKHELIEGDLSADATFRINKEILAELNTSEDGIMDVHIDSVGKDQKPEILIIEDNEEMQEFIRGILKKDFKVQTANNGKEACEILNDKGFSLIISDLLMPEMDGMEFCAMLRKILNTSHIPVILLTAKTDIKSQISGLKDRCG